MTSIRARRSGTWLAGIVLFAAPCLVGSHGMRATAADGDAAPRLVPLTKNGAVLLDAPGRRVVLKGKVVLRQGLLEMLVCKKQTKEHESILSVDAPVFVVHTALLAIGAKPGTGVRYSPRFQPPTGQKIDVFLAWQDDKGKLHRVPAQQWIRHSTRRYHTIVFDKLPEGLELPKDSDLKYDPKTKELFWFGIMSAAQRDALLSLSKDETFRAAVRKIHDESQIRPMTEHWVFAGSSFFVDDKTGDRLYEAEGGDVVCVANFTTAMLDVASESSSRGEESLVFEAWEDRIPPVGTEVSIELIPVPDKPGAKQVPAPSGERSSDPPR
jgi:hypothetical protein